MRNKVGENHGKYRITGEDNRCQPCIGFVNPDLEQHHAEHNVNYPQGSDIPPVRCCQMHMSSDQILHCQRKQKQSTNKKTKEGELKCGKG